MERAKKVARQAIIPAVVAVAFLLLDHFYFDQIVVQKVSQTRSNDSRVTIGSSLVNPLLDCADIDTVPDSSVESIKGKINRYIENQKEARGLTAASVYFRDLNNGPWFLINEKEDFVPASLLKVPLMMSVFREAMADPKVLERKLTIKDDTKNSGENYKGGDFVKKGMVYSVDELVASMIEHSDNNASHALTEIIDLNTLNGTYHDLGVALPEVPNYTLSIRSYASFFRILFNATYLNKTYSEKALELLTKTDFRQGIVAGVEKGVRVAHKFGERRMSDKAVQLHDCGIVYVPGNPYLLCVMTRGANYDGLDDVVAGVSKIVYDGVVAEEKP